MRVTRFIGLSLYKFRMNTAVEGYIKWRDSEKGKEKSTFNDAVLC
jgi:hypothetical protein